MNIKIYLEGKPEELAKVLQFIAEQNGATTEPVKQDVKSKPVATQDVKSEPVKQDVKSEPVKQDVTLQDLKEMGREVAAKQKQKEMKTWLGERGAKTLSTLNPEHYGECLEYMKILSE